MGATSLIMIAWPNWMRERPFSSTVSNRSRSGAFVTNAISIYTPLSCVGKLLQMGRDHCTIAKKSGAADQRIELSVPEVRRLLQAVGEAEEQQARRLHWSHFRRQHQGRAQRFHR